jgi:ferredoxin--NADP+ reductase
MFRIIKKQELSEKITLFDIEAKDIAKKAEPGNFILLITHEEGERIPLTIADFDRDKGTITIVFQKVGKTTFQLGSLNEGDGISNVVGPLGHPSNIKNFGTVICVGGGVGIAPLYPVTRALRLAGNRIYSIIGARTRSLFFWEERMREVSDDLIITTDDGSYGRKALVTVPLDELLRENKEIGLVYAIGPVIMMKSACKTTEKYKVQTIVSLNSIMVDGTGMCGGCRVNISGKRRFCCVDGPEFDGHEVDFDLIMKRQKMYADEEKRSLDRYASETAGE